MSDIREIADKLVNYCRTNDTQTGLNELYAADAVSVEAMAMPGGDSAETKGLDGIRGKHEWWESSFEYHGGNVDGPYMHGDNQFGVIFEMDVTEKATGERSQMKEMAVYTVENGKIAKEQFYYTMQG